MKDTYWDKFMITGSISDYLSYKMEKETVETEQKSPLNGEKDQDYKNVTYFRSDMSGNGISAGNERV